MMIPYNMFKLKNLAPKRYSMQITDIKIRRTFEEGPLRAVVSLTFDDQLAVHDVKVIYARDHYFVVMPSLKKPDGTFRDVVHPIHSDFRGDLENAVIEAYHTHVENEKNAPQTEAELVTY